MACILEKSRYLVLLAVGASLVAVGRLVSVGGLEDDHGDRRNDHVPRQRPVDGSLRPCPLEQKLRPVEAFQARGHVNDGRP